MDKDIFKIETQYKIYLERVGLKEGDMSLIDKIETKRAFYAGAGQILLISRDDLVDYCKEDEDKAVVIFEEMIQEIGEFWERESVKQEIYQKLIKPPASPLDVAHELFTRHSHAEIENGINPDQIVYTEQDVIDILKTFGICEPDWDGYALTLAKGT